MSIFSFFNGTKDEELLQSMKNYLKQYMFEYAKEHPRDMDDVVEIFDNTRIMLNSITPKDVRKAMRKNNVSAKCGVLNILQNNAMAQIQPGSTRDFLLGYDPAYEMYMSINKEKLEKGFISQKQYDENRTLAVCLKTNRRYLG